MKTRVLDFWPVLEWINDRQPATKSLRSLLVEAETHAARLFMSTVNVGEAYYFLCKDHSRDLAESWRELSGTMPLKLETPSLDEIWDAAVLKGSYPIAYADAFAVALAQKYNCPLVTGGPELRSIPRLELSLELDWIERGASSWRNT